MTLTRQNVTSKLDRDTLRLDCERDSETHRGTAVPEVRWSTRLSSYNGKNAAKLGCNELCRYVAIASELCHAVAQSLSEEASQLPFRPGQQSSGGVEDHALANVLQVSIGDGYSGRSECHLHGSRLKTSFLSKQGRLG